MLQDKQAILQVLGCIAKKPELLLDDKYKLSVNDFPEKFHHYVFGALYNLIHTGAKKIDATTVDTYLSSYPNQYQVFTDNKGMEYINSILTMSNIENFDYNYNLVIKHSLLNQLQTKGFDISDIYDEEETIDKKIQENQQSKFNKMTPNDIINHFENKIDKIKNDYYREEGQIGQKAGEGLREYKEKLKEIPEMGMPLSSKFLNTVVRGARLKKFYIRSSPSGYGKCITGDSLIFTDQGLLRIDEIPKYYKINNSEVKATIVNYDLLNCKSQQKETSHWYNMGKQQTYKILSNQGYTIEGTAEHPIVIMDEQNNLIFKRLSEIKKTDRPVISLKNNLWGNKKLNEDLAYLLGFLTGDGYLNDISPSTGNYRGKMSFSKQDTIIANKVIDIIKQELPENGKISLRGTKDYDFGTIETREFLKSLGLKMTTAHYKEVPNTILQGDKNTVRKFLQGLFDTDACISNNYFEYSTASKIMAEQIHILLLNYGIISTKRSKIVNGETYYSISITNYPMMKKFADEIGFSLCKYKQEKLCKAIEKEYYNNNNDFCYNVSAMMELHEFLKINIDSYKTSRIKKLCYQYKDVGFYNSLINSPKRKRISRSRIQKIVNDFPNNEELNYLRNLVNNIYVDTIKEITIQENVVYDFTVPDNHNFVSNGFISHNTRLAAGDACSLAIRYYYDWTKKKWIDTGIEEPTLFITTELEIPEIQSLLFSYVSGLSEEKFLDGKYTEEEEKIANQAIEYIENSPIWIEQIPNFDIDDIERTIKKYKLNHGIGYVFFDYIFTSVKILMDIAQKANGVKLREDNILYIFSDRMKFLANKLNIFIFSATQVNGEWENVQNANMNIIRGCKAIADKLDVGYVSLPVTAKDLKSLEPIFNNKFSRKPNFVYHVYKVRRGKFNNIKIWLYIDLGTCRTYDLFVTDNNYSLIDIEKTTIEKVLELTEDNEEEIIEKEKSVDVNNNNWY